MHVTLCRSQVHPAHHALKHFHVIYVEMPQPLMLKLQIMQITIGIRQNTHVGPIHPIHAQLVYIFIPRTQWPTSHHCLLSPCIPMN